MYIAIANDSAAGWREAGRFESTREAWEALADLAREREDGNPSGFSATVNTLDMFSRGQFEVALASSLDEDTGVGTVTSSTFGDWYRVDDLPETEQVTLGTVSSGTLRTQDLLRAYWAAIPSTTQVALFKHEEIGDLVTAYSANTLFGQEYEDTLLEALTSILEDLAPEGYRFGALEGDGACFGFWEVEEDEGDLDRAMDEQDARVANAFHSVTPVAWPVPEAQEDYVLVGHDGSAMAASSDFLMAAWYVWGAIDFAPDRTVDGVKVSVDDVRNFAHKWWTLCQDGARTHRPSMHDAFLSYLHGRPLTQTR